MRCETLRSELPLYIDDVLSEDSRNAIKEHLPTCPLCRQRHTEFVEIRNRLRVMRQPSLPPELNAVLIGSMTERFGQGSSLIVSKPAAGIREKLSHWILPYCAGTVGAMLFVVLFLNFLLVKPYLNDFGASGPEKSGIPLASDVNRDAFQENIAYPRIEIPDKSPEINPAGALIALTRSIVRGKMTDEEVVVVADVFGDGLANISEIVDPPNNERAMRELEKAFKTNPDQAPFLPAKMGRDADAVRVVLRIQRVDVNFR